MNSTQLLGVEMGRFGLTRRSWLRDSVDGPLRNPNHQLKTVVSVSHDFGAGFQPSQIGTGFQPSTDCFVLGWVLMTWITSYNHCLKLVVSSMEPLFH